MPSGIYKRTEKNNNVKGKHWKVKDTSNMKGYKPWNKGKKDLQVAWNKGLSKETDERVNEYAKKISIANLEGRCGMLNKRHTSKAKEKQRQSHLGKRYCLSEKTLLKRKGTHRTTKTKKKIRKWQLSHPNKKFSNTVIEQKIAEELSKQRIAFKQNIGIRNIANVDFYLPEHNIIIECDGDYWHNLPGRQERDKRKTILLEQNNYIVYRFWEHEINKSAEKCISRVNLCKI